MGGKEDDYKPAERTIHLMCQLRLVQDITLVLVAKYGGEPERIPLKEGTNLSLIDDRQMFCATEEGCGNGPLVRIDETREVDNDHRYIGRNVVIPARFLRLHPNVL